MFSAAVEALRSEEIERLTLTDPSYSASFDRIVRLTKTLMKADAAAFSVLDGGRQFFKAHQGQTVRETRRDVSFCTHTIEQNDLFLIEDAHEDPRFADSPLANGPEGHRFYVGLPVRAPSGLPLGALCVLNKRPRTLVDSEREAMEDLRGALEESLMLRSLAIVDGLTGLLNRRHFQEVAKREWLRAFAAQPPVAVVMIDIDYFKKYNDHYGHAQGDVALKTVARTLQTGARRMGDIVARIGGEEFGMIFPDCTETDFAEVAESILQRVRALELPHAASPHGQVTVSIGGMLVPPDGSKDISFAKALKLADEALYQAKAEGRNRFVMHPGKS
jgi:diguanylate cyclase (GGDEF)-like protein